MTTIWSSLVFWKVCTWEFITKFGELFVFTMPIMSVPMSLHTVDGTILCAHTQWFLTVVDREMLIKYEYMRFYMRIFSKI